MDQAFLVGRIGLMVAAPLGGVLWLGAGSGEHHYDVPPAQVLSSVANAYVPTHVLGSTVKGSRVSLPDNRTVVTALIAHDGTELMRFVTRVEADGQGSSVSTTVEPPKGTNAERAEAVMKNQGFVMSLMEKLAQEHVDAAIEKRPFNMMAFNPAGEAMLNTMPGMKAQIEQANEAAASMAQMEQNQFHESDGDSEGGWGADAGSGSDWGE